MDEQLEEILIEEDTTGKVLGMRDETLTYWSLQSEDDSYEFEGVVMQINDETSGYLCGFPKRLSEQDRAAIVGQEVNFHMILTGKDYTLNDPHKYEFKLTVLSGPKKGYVFSEQVK